MLPICWECRNLSKDLVQGKRDKEAGVIRGLNTQIHKFTVIIVILRYTDVDSPFTRSEGKCECGLCLDARED